MQPIGLHEAIARPTVADQAGPTAMPALFCNPYAVDFHGWVGYEFDVTLPLPRQTETEPHAVDAAQPPAAQPNVRDIGRKIPILWWQEEVYRGTPGGAANVDIDTLTFRVRMPESTSNFGYAFAGIETKNCTSLRLRCSYDRYLPAPSYGEMGDNRFVGIVLDYHTPLGYSRRGWLHCPKFRADHPDRRSERRAPTWHMFFSRLSRIDEANWQQIHDLLPESLTFTLDIKKYAPPDWDGRMWFGIGIQDAGSHRRFAAKILDRK